MPTTVIAAVVFVALAAYVLLRWLRARAKAAQAAASAASAEFSRRLRSPDLNALEKHLGHTLPRSLHALYADRALLQSDDILTLTSAWPGCEG